MRKVRALLLTLTLCLGVTFGFGQQSQPIPQQQTPAPPVSAQEPEHTMTKAEGEELFRSVDEILQFASQETGLPIKHPVKRQLASRAQVEKYLEGKMDEDGDSKRLERSAVTLKKLGLIPRDFKLREFLTGLLKEQVVGFYDAKTKTVYLLDWVAPEAQKPVLAHELTHALQDQNFDLERWSEITKKVHGDSEEAARDEAQSARTAVVEGQAMVVLLDYLLKPMGQSVKTSPQIVEAMKAGMLLSGATPMYSHAPIYLREALLFPYTYGLDFERSVLDKSGVAAAYAGVFQNPPVDTHQVIQPDSYLRREMPSALSIAPLEKALGSGWERVDFGGLGEMDIRIIAKQWRGDVAAERLAPALRNGYYMTFQAKGNKDAPVGIAMITRWASAADARSFASLYGTALEKRYRNVVPVQDSANSWMTDEGLVQVSTQGDLVTATESFDSAIAVKVREAMLHSAALQVQAATVH